MLLDLPLFIAPEFLTSMTLFEPCGSSVWLWPTSGAFRKMFEASSAPWLKESNTVRTYRRIGETGSMTLLCVLGMKDNEVKAVITSQDDKG
jgi:hypothetical protein